MEQQKKIKILHVWNTAGVASLMRKHLLKNGYESDVMMRIGYDPFGMCEYYGVKLLNIGGNAFINEVIKRAESYDIIHVHGIWQIVERLKKKYKSKKIILQHHGTELSKCQNNSERINSYKYCDEIICSTSDLSLILKYENIKHHLIENAVDTCLFNSNNINQNKYKDALLFDIRYTDLELTKQFVKSNSDWSLMIVDRELNFIKYTEFPLFLSRFDKYVDVKIYDWLNGMPGKAYSKTGREALSCGLSVLNYKGEIVSGLPDEFKPEYMIDKLIHLYES